MTTLMASRPLLLRSAPAPRPTVTQIACENIRVALIWNQMKRKDLASLLGVSYDRAGGIWNGNAKLTVQQMAEVASALRIPLERFLVEHDEHSWSWIYE